MEPNEPVNTKFYQLGNGGDLVFERDLNALSDFLERPHPEFHGIETQKDLDASRVYANQTHAHIAEQGEAIKLLARDRKTLRQQRAKKDATIARLRARIACLEAITAGRTS
ncbi:hypothetical protein QYE76_034631 [Lolium multiflorum]|uniref:Uncharacterized protein n=1 Tax=Lolium multiflorum TaxID=4521 RepID=A0AAD8QXR0_LOLMU|nr:hypothetical protein QYE76_034631 [Lolium multiflorum]